MNSVEQSIIVVVSKRERKNIIYANLDIEETRRSKKQNISSVSGSWSILSSSVHSIVSRKQISLRARCKHVLMLQRRQWFVFNWENVLWCQCCCLRRRRTELMSPPVPSDGTALCHIQVRTHTHAPISRSVAYCIHASMQSTLIMKMWMSSWEWERTRGVCASDINTINADTKVLFSWSLTLGAASRWHQIYSTRLRINLRILNYSLNIYSRNAFQSNQFNSMKN